MKSRENSELRCKQARIGLAAILFFALCTISATVAAGIGAGPPVFLALAFAPSAVGLAVFAPTGTPTKSIAAIAIAALYALMIIGILLTERLSGAIAADVFYAAVIVNLVARIGWPPDESASYTMFNDNPVIPTLSVAALVSSLAIAFSAIAVGIAALNLNASFELRAALMWTYWLVAFGLMCRVSLIYSRGQRNLHN